MRGLAVTGAVITSAGIVLAGTFSALAVLPLVSLTEIGFTIAVGVLIDTFIVRSLLVPALVLEIGDRGLVAVGAGAGEAEVSGGVAIAVGAVVGLAVGILVSVTTDLPLAPEVGLALGALGGWLLSRGQTRR